MVAKQFRSTIDRDSEREFIMMNRVLIASLILLAATMPCAGYAAGIDTATSGLTALQSWLKLWAPVAAGIGVAVLGLTCVFTHVGIRDVARPIFGLLIFGSASYIVSFFIS